MRKIIPVIIVSALILNISCSNYKRRITLSGVVTDNQNNLLENVLVKIGENEFTTDSNGAFIFEDIYYKSDFGKVVFEKKGYCKLIKTIEQEIGVVQLKASLTPYLSIDPLQNEVKEFNIGKGIALEAANADFNKKNVIIKSGVEFPYNYNFPYQLPGNEMKTADNNLLVSYALLNFEFYSGEEKAALKPEKNISLKLYVDNNPMSQLPKSLDLFYYDGQNNEWVNKGVAKMQDTFYAAQIDGAGYWLLAQVSTANATVMGKVYNKKGIEINGQDLRIMQYGRVTNKNGEYICRIPAFQYTVMGIRYESHDISNEIPETPQNDTATIDLYVDELTMITGEIVDCDGQPLPGQVQVVASKKTFATGYFEDGRFNCFIPDEEKHAIVIVKSGGEIMYLEMKNNNKSSEYDLGKITFCKE